MELSGSEEFSCQPERETQRKDIALEKIWGKRRRPDQSQATIRSQRPSKGEEHVPLSGKTVRVKQMGPGCKESCRYKCHSRVTYEERLEVHNDFYRTAPTLGQQWEYIRRTVQVAPKKDSTRPESRRANSYSYSFRIKEEARKVCKTMYLSTLQISNTVVDTAVHKRRGNGTTSPSIRGAAPVPNASWQTRQDLKDSVSEYINMVPGMIHRNDVLWLLKKKAVASSEAEDLRLSADRGNGHDMCSEDNSASESDVRAEIHLDDPSLSDDAIYDTPLNVVTTEMELSGSEESNSQPEPKEQRKYIALEKTKHQNQRPPDQSEAIISSPRTSEGEECVARSGKTGRAKQMGPGCKENCRYHCHSKMTYEERLGVYTDFYQTAPTLQKQWEYICRTVTKAPKKESTREESRRANSYSYSFLIKNELRKVCKTMYLSTLQISNSIIETAFEKRRENGTVSPSKRGKASLPNNSSRRIPQELKDSVREHINMFPRVPSHCCGKETTREFVQGGTSVAKMHRTYVLWMLKKKGASNSDLPTSADQGNSRDVSCDNSASESLVQAQFRLVDTSLIDGKIIATERQYRDIFDSEFNLAFFSPKKNQCDECVEHMRGTAEEKAE